MGRVLVTGATGFVGQAVIRGLAAHGADVVCVNRTGGNIKNCVQIIETMDVFSHGIEWWTETCQDVDMVIHVAWYAEPGKYLTSDKNLDCLSGTLNLARGAALAGVRKFVGVGTCFEYDLAPGELSVSTRLNPVTPYAAAKASTYVTLNQYLPLQGVEFLWARLFYLYGQGEDPRRLVPYLHQQMQAGERADLTSGTQVRDFMDVDDAAALLLEDAFSNRTGATNIASGQGITVRALAEQIADHYGRRDLLNFGARPDNLTDPPCVIGLRDTETRI
ncbi:NAD(P)-dependent oxidoreductase [Rhodobacteraceae bacterium M382]|nr:NAD(P)-dependent oxidoreductase [Rhodobacteraceae bacterium M382]